MAGGAQHGRRRARRLEAERLEGAVLTVSVPDRFVANWVGSHYSVELEQQARAEFGDHVGRVAIVVRGEARVA